jgi:cyclophilin family peptidyl-prolyl cis-trans isomerase
MLSRKAFMPFVVLALFSLVLFGCSQKQEGAGRPAAEKKAEPQATEKAGGEEVAVIETDFGKIVFKFYEKEAPQHTANFKKLARQGFYDGCTFHRVIPNFMIQAGDPLSKDDDRSNDGTGGPGYTVPAEIGVKHTRGSVAAARRGDQVNPEKASSGSQFYICVVDLPNLDAAGYSVFGQVIEGMDVADQIVNVQRDQRDNPLQKVVMKKVSIESR